jgi:trigger factor
LAELNQELFDKLLEKGVASLDELKAKIKEDAETQFAQNRPKIIRRCY